MSKRAILGAIRRGLRWGELPKDQKFGLGARMAARPRHLAPARGQVVLFTHNVEGKFSTVVRVADLAAIPAAVANYLASQNLPTEFAIGLHAGLRANPWDTRPLLRIRKGRARTGTIMLPYSPERPTTLKLLCNTAIA